MASALFLLVLALGAIVAGVGYVRVAYRMRHFRATAGRVIAREVVTVPSGDTTEGRFGQGGGYMPKITYTYTVDGVERVGDRMAYAARGWKRAIAEQRLAAIPDSVEVWYDPSDPREAWIERHSPAIGYALVAGGAVAALAAVGWLAAHAA